MTPTRMCTHAHTCAHIQIHIPLTPDPCSTTGRREGELVEHFAAKCNKQLAAKLAELKATGELAQLRTRGTLSLAVKLRLQMITPFIDTWPQVMIPFIFLNVSLNVYTRTSCQSESLGGRGRVQ